MLLGAIEHVVRKGGDAGLFMAKFMAERTLPPLPCANEFGFVGIEDFNIARELLAEFADAKTGVWQPLTSSLQTHLFH